MSTLAKTAFFSSCAFTIGAIGYVHYRQLEDRYILHQGIIRDTELQHRKQMANQHNLQAQIEITKRLKDQQEKNAKNMES